MPEFQQIVIVVTRLITTQQPTRRMQVPSFRPLVLLAIRKLHGHLPLTITIHNISPLTAGGIKVNGLCVVNVIQMLPIMRFLIACFAMHTAIKRLWIQNIRGKADMPITALIVCHAIREELLINTTWTIFSQNSKIGDEL
jgi:hypothetical protein